MDGNCQNLFPSISRRNQSVCSLVKAIVSFSISLPGAYPPAPLEIFFVSREVPSALTSIRIATGWWNVRSQRNPYDSVFCVFEDYHNEGSSRALSCSEYHFARNSSLPWLEDNEPVGKYLTWAIVAVLRKEMIARAKRSRISHQRWKVYCKFSDAKER